jgi:hypothetical protein
MDARVCQEQVKTTRCHPGCRMAKHSSAPVGETGAPCVGHDAELFRGVEQLRAFAVVGAAALGAGGILRHEQ